MATTAARASAWVSTDARLTAAHLLHHPVHHSHHFRHHSLHRVLVLGPTRPSETVRVEALRTTIALRAAKSLRTLSYVDVKVHCRSPLEVLLNSIVKKRGNKITMIL